MIAIRIQPRKLSDGSEVHDVYVGDLAIPATTADDAYELACSIQTAIETHSVESAKIVEG